MNEIIAQCTTAYHHKPKINTVLIVKFICTMDKLSFTVAWQLL